MVVSFNLAGGTNGIAYGVFTTTNIGSPQWTWIENIYTCSTVYLTNQPSDVAFYALGAISPTMVVAWGDNTFSECNVPEGLTDAIAIAGGGDGSPSITAAFSTALRANGTVIAWGDNTHGQTNVPSGLTGVAVITAGAHHSLTLGFDGKVSAWGSWKSGGSYSNAIVPLDLTNAISIAAGEQHDLAVRCNGSVVAWAYDTNDSAVIVPTNLPPARDVAAGWFHSVALLTNGTVRAWGDDTLGQVDVPSNLSNVVEIAAGTFHTLALKSDGTVAAWGADNAFSIFWGFDQGQSIVPYGLSNVVAVAASLYHSMALQSSGNIVMWGNGLSLPSYSFSPVASIGSGWQHALAIRSGPLTPIIVIQPTNQTVLPGANATFSVRTIVVAGTTYQWQTNAVSISGATNSTLTLTNVNTAAQGTYRVKVTSPAGFVISSNALLTVFDVTPPVITSFTQPSNQIVIYALDSTLSVSVAAQGQSSGFPLHYQWQSNGSDLPGATSSNYTFSGLVSGIYSVVITNAVGSTNAIWQVTTTYTGSYVAPNTLAYHLATNAVSHTNGYIGSNSDKLLLSGWDYAQYSGTNLALLTNAVWSTNFWLKGVHGLSATCIGLSNSLGGQGLVTMISPRHCLYATHVHPYQGRFMAAFLATNNVIHWRTNLQNVVLENDTSLGILNEDLPLSIEYLPVVPTNLLSYLPTNSASVVQGIGMNQGMKLFSQPIAFLSEAVVWNPNRLIPFGLGTNWSIALQSGDSSAPERLLVGDQLVLLSHNFTAGGGPNYASQIGAINQKMHYLSTNNNVGTDYQLTTFILTNWPTIH